MSNAIERTTESDDDVLVASAEVRRSATVSTVAAIFLIGVIEVVAGFAVLGVAPQLGRSMTVLTAGVVAALFCLPLMILISRSVTKRRIATVSRYVGREREVRAASRSREFATRVSNALEMAETEEDVLSITESVMETLAPDTPVELLLADNSHAHLVRMAVSSPAGEPPGCPVGSPRGCVSARRTQTMVFADSRDFDVCPKLRERVRGPCSAVCVPVSIFGRAVGVLHGVRPVDEPPGDDIVSGFQVVAEQIGARLGMLRMVSESQLQASTDGLTGLFNRRTLENGARRLRLQGTSFAVAIADLDAFKALNDRHGHETGDRALRVFADVLRTAVRESDVVCRFGGEEFAIVFPGCSLADARLTLERVRENLARALVAGTAPAFTCSFGLAAPDDQADFEELARRADDLLYQAKHAGGDRIVAQGDPSPPDGSNAEQESEMVESVSKQTHGADLSETRPPG